MASLPSELHAGAEPEAQPYGEVFDRGYRHYEGPREGRGHAIRALIWYSVKRGLGLKKRWTAKIIPFALYAISFLPVIVFIGVKALLGSFTSQVKLEFSYFDLYGGLWLIILVFAAGVAPEMICDDRREHVVQLYLSRAIKRGDYLFAKITALGFLIGTIAFLPAFVLFLGYTFLAENQVQYFWEHLGDLPRILAAGTLIGLFYAAVSLVVAAYVDRKGIATATSIGGMLIVAAIASAVFETVRADWHRYLVLVNPSMVGEGITRWIFVPANRSAGSSEIIQAGLDGSWYLISVLVVALACGVVMYRQYLAED